MLGSHEILKAGFIKVEQAHLGITLQLTVDKGLRVLRLNG
jgi:hypothetical protein